MHPTHARFFLENDGSESSEKVEESAGGHLRLDRQEMKGLKDGRCGNSRWCVICCWEEAGTPQRLVLRVDSARVELLLRVTMAVLDLHFVNAVDVKNGNCILVDSRCRAVIWTDITTVPKSDYQSDLSKCRMPEITGIGPLCNPVKRVTDVVVKYTSLAPRSGVKTVGASIDRSRFVGIALASTACKVVIL